MFKSVFSLFSSFTCVSKIFLKRFYCPLVASLRCFEMNLSENEVESREIRSNLEEKSENGGQFV